MSGYDENFLAVTVPLPVAGPGLQNSVLHHPDLADGIRADYPNYTVVTNHDRRSPIFAALNMDQSQWQPTTRSDSWRVDSRVGSEFQLNNDYYASNPWDRGHLAMRDNASWGVDAGAAQEAADETFYFSNAALQHKDFNQDEWLKLENWVHNLELDKDEKVTSFSGPFYGDYPRCITPEGRPMATIPGGFFKVVCFVNKDTDNLDVRAFIMYQDRQAMSGRLGSDQFDFKTYQVTVKEIENLTGLIFFPEVGAANPLFFESGAEATAAGVVDFPERVEISSSEEIIARDGDRIDINDDVIDVFITAALVNPEDRDLGNEWVSIINVTNDEVDLNRWTLSDTKRDLDLSTLDDASRVIAPGEAVSIKKLGTIRLTNTGGVIALYEPSEQVGGARVRVDRVSYMAKDVEPGVPVVFGIRRDPVSTPSPG